MRKYYPVIGFFSVSSIKENLLKNAGILLVQRDESVPIIPFTMRRSDIMHLIDMDLDEFVMAVFRYFWKIIKSGFS